MKPILSIVVPVYNAEAFVARTIENLLAESVSKEIILVNDGSTDGSLEILQTYASKYSCIKVINQENSGVSSARNVGMDAAIGEYIFFNDCDDIQEIGTLTRAVDYFDIGVDAVIFSYKNRHKAQRKAKFYINKCRSASCMQSGLKQASA